MIDFSICSYRKTSPDEAADILFSYLGHMDKVLPDSVVDEIIGPLNSQHGCFCDFMAGDADDLFALVGALDGQEYFRARMVINWYLACLGHSGALANLVREMNQFKHTVHRCGGDLKVKFEAALESWGECSRRKPSLRKRLMRQSDQDRHFEQIIDTALAPSPGLVVVEGVGDSGSREGKGIAERYADIVGVPLPYKGSPGPISTLYIDLLESFPWAENVVDYVCGQLALLECAKSHRERLVIPSFLLAGKSGAGKTRFLTDLSERLGLPSTLIACGGTADSGGLLPVARGWASSRVSGPVQAIVENKCANPCLILDEVDKASKPESGGQNGNMTGALLSMMDGGQKAYYDTCLMADVNLSAISFLATANDVSVMPVPLLDRFMVLDMPLPSEEHFDLIFSRIRADEAARIGASVEDVPELDDLELETLHDTFIQKGDVSIRSVKRAYRSILGAKCLKRHLPSGKTLEIGKMPDPVF